MIVSRRLSTVLLMRLIALSSQLHFAYGIPIGDANKCTDELDYRSVEKLFSAEEQAGTVVATEQSKLLSEAVGALQTDGKEFSHSEYDPYTYRALLNSVYEPILLCPMLTLTV